MKITQDFIKKVIKMASMSREEELGCNDCFERLHSFAEMKLQGKTPEEAMPLVQDHLDKCGDCREEYKVLLDALRSVRA